jgi:hypothetical protein
VKIKKTKTMNDFLFYALILALLYYFFYYLPQQKQLEPTKPFTHSQGTQTNPSTTESPELEKTLDDLITSIQQLNQSLK